MQLAPNIPMMRKVKADVESPPTIPPSTMTVYTDWLSAELEWTYTGTNWYDPCLMQRNTTGSFSAPNFSVKQDYENYIWIGIRKANRYKDMGLDEGTTYYYRIAYITNWPSVVRDGASPTYTAWQYGQAAIPTRAQSGIPTTIYNVENYGAFKNGTGNSWSAIKAAVDAAKAGGGGRVYIPAGTYLIYPPTQDVKWNGTNLTVGKDQNFTTTFISGNLSNVVIYGDTDGSGNPTSIVNCKLWHNQSGQKWLAVLNTPSGNPNNDNDIHDITRYTFCVISNNTNNFILKDIKLDGTADPVDAPIGSRSIYAQKYGWDTSHKVTAGYNISARNIYWENVIALNWRAEMAFWGGFRCEGYKLKGCLLGRSNSSITSMSSGVEFEDCVFEDYSNVGVENVPHSLTHDSTSGNPLISNITGRRFYHDSIIRNCTFDAIKSGGVFEAMTEAQRADNFTGYHIFNQEGTYTTITDTLFKHQKEFVLAPWHECFNSFHENITITEPFSSKCQMIFFNPNPKVNYRLSGGTNYVYWGNINITLGTENLDNIGLLFKCNSFVPSFQNVIIDKVTLDGNGRTANRLWWDKDSAGSTRDNFQVRDWTVTNLTMNSPYSPMSNMMADKNALPLPLWEDFDVEWQRYTSGNVRVDWGQMEGNGTFSVTGISNINKLKENSIIKFRSNSGSQTFVKNSSWNTFTQNYTVTTSTVLTCKVVRVGSLKLQYQSLA